MSEPDDSPLRVMLLGLPLPAVSEGAPTPCTVLDQPERDSLVRAAREQAPQALLLHLDGQAAGDGRLEAWLDVLEDGRPLLAAPVAAPMAVCGPLPIIAIVPGATAAQRRRGLAAGIEVWLETAPPPDALQRQLHWALWQAQRLAAVQAQLDDRKWTDRAKGLLMAARDLDEDSAFRLLRDAAMHAHLRLGEVARSVVQAAQLAEAVNLAGQQRMLSQRLLKLMAQRAAGIEPKRAKALQDDSCARVEANLARLPVLLSGLPAQGPATPDLAPLIGAWSRLRPWLNGKPGADALQQADAAAQALLEQSEQFTNAVEAAGAGRPLQLVNLCGRQRMLSQRLAKEALLADLLPGRDPAALGEALDRFAAGLAELEAAPLSSEPIRELLAEVRAEWLRLMRSLRDTHGAEAAAGLARSSEVLLDRLDKLTAQYQSSLQTLLG